MQRAHQGKVQHVKGMRICDSLTCRSADMVEWTCMGQVSLGSKIEEFSRNHIMKELGCYAKEVGLGNYREPLSNFKQGQDMK